MLLIEWAEHAISISLKMCLTGTLILDSIIPSNIILNSIYMRSVCNTL